ncbi:uncharacterized protein MONBRDRAFT_38199 [Monosiga brevicollis MX1]|uniref:SWIM-type domain-containing protein n=1 Tax=Monosiga brevicollis TaxID=81824 RepID=A9V689_MONBE|nr:uncharacterized protein MONBRDRAFT_38199 [Monosiga brevicollis MX1]EDQ86948.1 predicted protein [Monosiga brevicollis MX1]|eukprot:XP_001748187.1 hypothetical protein [Monosiga brevicollis MX1]
MSNHPVCALCDQQQAKPHQHAEAHHPDVSLDVLFPTFMWTRCPAPECNFVAHEQDVYRFEKHCVSAHPLEALVIFRGLRPAAVQCDCGRLFATKSGLRRHVRDHHCGSGLKTAEKSEKCDEPDCSFVSVSEAGLKRHKQKKHGASNMTKGVICQRLGNGSNCIFDPQQCERRFHTREKWLQHAIEDHKAPFELKQLSFLDEAAFDAWNHALHQERGLRYDLHGTLYNCSYNRSSSALKSVRVRNQDAINLDLTPEMLDKAAGDRCYSFFRKHELPSGGIEARKMSPPLLLSSSLCAAAWHFLSHDLPCRLARLTGHAVCTSFQTRAGIRAWATIDEIRQLSRLGVSPARGIRKIQSTKDHYARDAFVDLKDFANHGVNDEETRLHENDDLSMQLNVNLNRSLPDDERFILDPETGRGLPVAHALASSVNTATTAIFLEAVWRHSTLVPAPAVVLTDMDNALIAGCFDAFCTRLQVPRAPKSRWCIFHVYRAWFGRVSGIAGDAHNYNADEMRAGLKALARARTPEAYHSKLAELRSRFEHATIPASTSRLGGSHTRQSFWRYFDTYFDSYKNLHPSHTSCRMDTTLGKLREAADLYASEIRAQIYKEKLTRYDKLIISCVKKGKTFPREHITKMDHCMFRVLSASMPGEYYNVQESVTGTWTCQCDWFDAYRRAPAVAARTCKHIEAVRFHVFRIDNTLRSGCSFGADIEARLEPYNYTCRARHTISEAERRQRAIPKSDWPAATALGAKASTSALSHSQNANHESSHEPSPKKQKVMRHGFETFVDPHNPSALTTGSAVTFAAATFTPPSLTQTSSETTATEHNIKTTEPQRLQLSRRIKRTSQFVQQLNGAVSKENDAVQDSTPMPARLLVPVVSDKATGNDETG